MKKLTNVSTLVIAGLITAYMTPFLAFGSELIDSFPIEYAISNEQMGSYSGTSEIGQSFQLTDDKLISSIYLNLWTGGYTHGSCDYRIGIYESSSGIFGTNDKKDGSALRYSEYENDSTLTASGYANTNELIKFTFPGDYIFLAYHTYVLNLERPICDSTNVRLGINDTPSAYGLGNLSFYNSGASPHLQSANIEDLIYYIYGESSYNPPTATTTYPIYGSTSVPNFSYWKAQMVLNDYQGFPASVRINYGISASTFSDFVDGYSFAYDIPGQFIDAEIPTKNDFLNLATYYYQAQFFDGNNVLLAESATSTFLTGSFASSDLNPQIDNSTIYENLNATTTASTTPMGLLATCDDQQGIINYSSCVLFSFLFTPHPSTLNNWENLKNLIIKKPPFGYFTIYQNGLNDLTISTTTKAYELADLSGLDTDYFNPIKHMLQVILIVAFTFKVFDRLKSVQL